jgi:lysine N6-hydroxylase
VEAATLTTDGRASLTCRHRDTGATFAHATDMIVAATGYRERTPRFLAPVAEAIRRDGRGRPRVAFDHRLVLDPRIAGRIYVSNADLHSHGVAAPDLGIGAYRNAVILNSVVGREVYALPQRTAFTSFQPPEPCHEGAARAVAHERRGTCADGVGREPLR